MDGEPQQRTETKPEWPPVTRTINRSQKGNSQLCGYQEGPQVLKEGRGQGPGEGGEQWSPASRCSTGTGITLPTEPNSWSALSKLLYVA